MTDHERTNSLILFVLALQFEIGVLFGLIVWLIFR